MNKQVSKRIAIFSFAMTVVIAAYHAAWAFPTINSLDNHINTFIDYFFNNTAILAMSFFFFTTGFLLFHNLSFDNLSIKIKRRTITVLLPYILWQIIALLIQLYNGTTWNFITFIKKTFLFDKWPPDGALWYLYVIYLLALMSPIFLLAFRNHKTGFIFIFMLICARHIPAISSVCKYGYLGNISSYIPAYLFGSFMGYFCSQIYDSNDLKYFRKLQVQVGHPVR